VSPSLKTATLAAVALGLLTFYTAAFTRNYQAHRAASSSSIEGLERAIALAPGNADYALLLARSRTLGLLQFQPGINEYKRALALNRYSSRGWLDLAAAYQMAGDPAGQREAMQQAVAVDPRTPGVAWEVATFYVVQGDVQRALPYYKTVLSTTEGDTKAVLEVLWSATGGDAALILREVLPNDVRSHIEFLRFASEQKNVAAANVVWERLVNLSGPKPVRSLLPYFELLLASGQSAQALAAWKQLGAVDAEMAKYMPRADNLIVNGDFEEELLGGGLDWKLQRHPSLDLKLDTLEFHSGNRSVSATFEQGGVGSLGLFQLVPVQGGAEYRFSAFAKSVELTTASGPRLLITDAYTGERYFFSDDQRGTTGWKEIQSVFRVKPETTLLKIELAREQWQPLIRGKLYLDELTLRPAQ